MKRKKLMGIMMSAVLISGMMTGCGAKNDTQTATATQASTQEKSQAEETTQVSEISQTPEVEGTITLKDGEWSDVFFNEEYKDEGLKTVKGAEAIGEDIQSYIAEEAGAGIVLPQNWIGTDVTIDYFIPDVNQTEIIAFRTEDINKLNELMNAAKLGNATNDECKDAYYNAVDAAFAICGFYCREADDTGSALFSDSDFGTKFAFAEKIGTLDGMDYYFVYNDTPPAEGFTDDEKSQIESILSSMDEFRQNAVIFPPHVHDYEAERAKEQEQVSGINLSEFEAKDLKGNTVTQDILKDYDITMVNIWTTWCGYCRKEMPDIQKAYENLPENANIIAFCMDAAEETDIANAIVDKSGVNFTVIAPDENLSDKISPYITGFPTTILVDSNGNLVGDPIIGAPSSGDVAQVYLDYINSALDQ